MRIRTKQYFKDAKAEKTWANVEKPQSLATRTRNVIMTIAKPHAKNCLSLGCGWGRFLKSYLEKDARRVVGADINKSNLLICRSLGADLVLCDIENLPLRSDTFDVMECVATMEHIEKPTMALKEMQRISAEGCSVFVSWPFFKWAWMLENQELRVRLILTLRDLIPNRIGRKLTQRRFFGFKDYGLFRNSGFSFDEVKRIYADASMPISSVGTSVVEGIFLVYSKVSK